MYSTVLYFLVELGSCHHEANALLHHLAAAAGRWRYPYARCLYFFISFESIHLSLEGSHGLWDGLFVLTGSWCCTRYMYLQYVGHILMDEKMLCSSHIRHPYLPHFENHQHLYAHLLYQVHLGYAYIHTRQIHMCWMAGGKGVWYLMHMHK